MARRAIGRWVAAAVAAVAALALAAVLAFLVAAGQLCITSAARPPDRFAGEIPVRVSPADRDGDGIDDQTDILCGALAYVRTRPHYRSAYYAGGYPDDGYGVCTDVVAAALRAAGYDLMRLVADDIAAAPEAYGIETPDAAIDYRRTGNLEVYFARNAEALTCEVSDIEAWQGGDIVLFDGHVGIVSDRRDARGVPYLIHHGSPFQLAYEEDRLDSYGAIVGHYRMGA